MEKRRFTGIVPIIVLLVIAILSILVLGKIFSNPSVYKVITDSLDKKKDAVLALTASSTGLSAALSLIPSDALTPIAEKLADLSTYFLIILCAISLEKLLLSAIGFVSFRVLIPAACIGYAISYILASKERVESVSVRLGARKILIFALVIQLIIPCSIGISNVIESVNNIDYGVETTETTEDTTTKEETSEESKTGITGFLDSLKDKVTSIGDTINDASKEAKEIKESAVQGLNKLLDQIAILIVTCCIIPILVFIVFYWLLKVLFNIDSDSKALKSIGKFVRKEDQE